MYYTLHVQSTMNQLSRCRFLVTRTRQVRQQQLGGALSRTVDVFPTPEQSMYSFRSVGTEATAVPQLHFLLEQARQQPWNISPILEANEAIIGAKKEATELLPLYESLFEALLDQVGQLIHAIDEGEDNDHEAKTIQSLFMATKYLFSVLEQVIPRMSKPDPQTTADTVDGALAIERCNAVLSIFAEVERIAEERSISSVGDLPEKANSILARMERSKQMQPNAETYTLVLSCWSRSQSALKGNKAEVVFRKLKLSEYSESNTACRAMIRVWAGSREPRSAFYATGHLRRILRSHNDDGDTRRAFLDINDYHAVLEAWTTARYVDSNGFPLSKRLTLSSKTGTVMPQKKHSRCCM